MRLTSNPQHYVMRTVRSTLFVILGIFLTTMGAHAVDTPNILEEAALSWEKKGAMVEQLRQDLSAFTALQFSEAKLKAMTFSEKNLDMKDLESAIRLAFEFQSYAHPYLVLREEVEYETKRLTEVANSHEGPPKGVNGAARIGKIARYDQALSALLQQMKVTDRYESRLIEVAEALYGPLENVQYFYSTDWALQSLKNAEFKGSADYHFANLASSLKAYYTFARLQLLSRGQPIEQTIELLMADALLQFSRYISEADSIPEETKVALISNVVNKSPGVTDPKFAEFIYIPDLRLSEIERNQRSSFLLNRHNSLTPFQEMLDLEKRLQKMCRNTNISAVASMALCMAVIPAMAASGPLAPAAGLLVKSRFISLGQFFLSLMRGENLVTKLVESRNEIVDHVEARGQDIQERQLLPNLKPGLSLLNTARDPLSSGGNCIAIFATEN